MNPEDRAELAEKAADLARREESLRRSAVRPDLKQTGRSAHSSAGLEFAVSLLVAGGAGYYLDELTDISPWGFLAGITLGFIAGIYRLLRISA